MAEPRFACDDCGWEACWLASRCARRDAVIEDGQPIFIGIDFGADTPSVAAIKLAARLTGTAERPADVRNSAPLVGGTTPFTDAAGTPAPVFPAGAKSVMPSGAPAGSWAHQETQC